MPLTRRDQLEKTLLTFYQNPIAKVSLQAFMSVAAIIFFAVFAVRPTLITISDLLKEIEDKQQLERQLSQKVAAISTAQINYQKNQENLTFLNEAIPPSPEIIRSLKIMEKAAGEAGVVIEGLSLAELPEEELASVNLSEDIKRIDLPVTVLVVGDYKSIKKFVEVLSNTRRTFVLHSIVFSVEDSRGIKLLKANMIFSLPYFRFEASAKGVK